MPSIEDWMNHPLGIIENIFSKSKSYESATVKQYFEGKLQGKNSLSWVPSLNATPLHELRANSLVRYRCMVQDMYDPEFYLGAYQVLDKTSGESHMRSGKYKDVAECGANQRILVESDKNITMDRMTLYCVPVAGETDWVKKIHSDDSRTKTRCVATSSKVPQRPKRGFDDASDSGQTAEDAMHGNHDNVQLGAQGAEDVAMETEDTKRQQTEKHTTATSGTNGAPDLNFPLPEETGPACLVKVYEDVNSFKVNDIVEFVGVLSVDPSLAHFHDDTAEGVEEQMLGMVQEESAQERHAHAPPPSLVPRLHAVLWHKLPHVNPLVPQHDTQEYATVLEQLQGDVQSLRTQILAVLQHALLGDKLAAEYLLCHLIATVYGRSDVVPLGKFCLNLSNCPQSPAYTGLLHHLIENIVTQSYLLDMSLEKMNSASFAPHKDYTANRLVSGILQLADQTNLILNETALQPGQLDTTGVRNLQALGNMISWQKVEYDFSFHRQDFHTNIATLILSEGKSILPSDCRVALAPEVRVEDVRTYFTQLDARLTEQFLVKWRTFLGLARNMPYTMTDDVQAKAQEDFVTMRKDDPKTMSVDDFHALLSLTRLLSLSHLKSSSTLDMWNRAKVLERLRRSRLADTAARNQATATAS